MYVEKEIKLNFTEAEEDAILEMITLTEAFHENCNSQGCDKCPLEVFCGYRKNVDDVKKSLKDFLEEK